MVGGRGEYLSGRDQELLLCRNRVKRGKTLVIILLAA